MLYKDLGGQLRAARPALPAPARRPVLRLGRGDRHPLQLSRLADGRAAAPASSSPTTTPSIRARAPRSAAPPRPIRCRNAPGCCWPIWVRSRRPSCRCGSRSPGRTASARSCSPTCPATGSSARRTPATRCTSNGCTRTGALRLAGETGPYGAQAPQAQVRGVRPRLRLQARARGPATSAIRTGPSAASRCGRTASISATISNGACRSTTRTRSASPGSSCACRRAASPTCRTTVPTWVQPDQGRQRPLDHEPRHQPGHHRLGRAGRDRRPHQGESRRQRPRHRDDAQALLRRARRDRARRGRRRA